MNPNGGLGGAKKIEGGEKTKGKEQERAGGRWAAFGLSTRGRH